MKPTTRNESEDNQQLLLRQFMVRDSDRQSVQIFLVLTLPLLCANHDLLNVRLGDCLSNRNFRFIDSGNHRLCRWRYPVKKLKLRVPSEASY